jgi:hypothetical protein
MSTICSLINSTSKLCRIDERPAKGTFLTLSLEPIDSLVDLLATFRARNFQRQIVEKHGLIQTINKLLELAKLGLIIALIRVLEKMIGRAIREWRDFGSLEKRIVPPQKFNVQRSHLIRHGCAAGALGCALPDEAPRGLLVRHPRNH